MIERNLLGHWHTDMGNSETLAIPVAWTLRVPPPYSKSEDGGFAES